jgi:glycosyltransferase involved in cell wall biosynthesis
MTTRRSLLILNERDPAHPRAGGAEIHIAAIFSRLAKRGHTIHQFSSGFEGGVPRETLGGVHIERVGPLIRYYASVPRRLLRMRRSCEFDLVIECLNKVPFYAPLFSGRPVLAVCHHLFGEVAFTQVAKPLAAAVWLSERFIARAYHASRFIAISESSRDDLIARGIPGNQIVVSHPGIERPQVEVDLDAMRPPRIAYFGRLEAYKRVDLLLHAASRLIDRFRDLEILVIGRGPERARLEDLAERLGLASRTRFTGFVSDAERDALLATTRACAFPSEKEGWGLTVIEANALGTPVVASDVPGLRDSVRDGETGLLVQPGDPEAMARALARLLEESAFSAQMQRAAHAWSQCFDWDRAADDMEAAIEQTIDERQP